MPKAGYGRELRSTWSISPATEGRTYLKKVRFVPIETICHGRNCY